MESLGISDELLARYVEKIKEAGHTLSVFDRCTDPEVQIREAKDADVMIVANMPVSNDVIRACDNLKYIDVAFTGVDHIGLDACRENNIKVSNASGYSTEAVAELAVGMALSISRSLKEAEEKCRSGGTKAGLYAVELRNRTVGIIGLGKIGTRSAELFHAFGADILAYSRRIHDDAPDYIRQTSFDEVLAGSDYLILHTPLTAETRGMINMDAFRKMKKNAIVINMARGPVINSDDLAEALNTGMILAAGTDVFDGEPPLDPSMPLLQAKNLTVTPHIGFFTEESMILRAEIVFDNLFSWLNGEQKNSIL